MIEAGMTGLSLKWPCRKNSWPEILYLPFAAAELTDASLRKRNGGWMGMTAAPCSIGMNLVGFGHDEVRILQSMKVFTSPTVRRLRNSSLLIDIWRTSSTRMTIS